MLTFPVNVGLRHSNFSRHPFSVASVSSPLSRVLVTGDDGFVGKHVIAAWPNAIGISKVGDRVDLRDKIGIRACIDSVQPDAVLHLAALSFVPDSFRAPETTFAVNFLGTLNVLEALTEAGFAGRFLFVGTGDAYGLVESAALPIVETYPLRPRNPYAVSKVAAEALCFQWSQTGPFEIMMARPFNHIGPGQDASFAIAGFGRQIAEIQANMRPPVLQVGNLDATRDFLDVRDVVDAYQAILAKGSNGQIYNVCSGVEKSIRSLLDRLVSLSSVDAEIVVDPSRARPAEQLRVCGSRDKITRETGWQPSIPLDKTLFDIFKHWEKKIGQ